MERKAQRSFQPENLSHYINEIKGHELLTREQEKNLSRRHRQTGDQQAADRLVRANLRLVVKIALDYHARNGRVPLSDLIQQGNLGLVRAVHKFDPAKETKLSYYAAFWIKAYVLQYLMDNYSSVRIGKTRAQRKLFYNLGKSKAKLRSKGLPTTPGQIARMTGVKAAEVEEMEKRMRHQDLSLDAPGGEHTSELMSDRLTAQQASAEQMVSDRQMIGLVHKITADFKSRLTRREQEILEQRIVSNEPLTLQNLGNRFGVSRERIRQIEKSIIRKLRQYFLAAMPGYDAR